MMLYENQKPSEILIQMAKINNITIDVVKPKPMENQDRET